MLQLPRIHFGPLRNLHRKVWNSYRVIFACHNGHFIDNFLDVFSLMHIHYLLRTSRLMARLMRVPPFAKYQNDTYRTMTSIIETAILMRGDLRRGIDAVG